MGKIAKTLNTNNRGYRKQKTYSEKRNMAIKQYIPIAIMLELIIFYVCTLAGGWAYDNHKEFWEGFSHIGEAFAISPFYGFPITSMMWQPFFLISALVLLGMFLLYNTDAYRTHHDINTLKGSSEWADIDEMLEKYAETVPASKYKIKNGKPNADGAFSNNILSEHFQMSFNTKINKIAPSTLIIGTTGSGKSRFYLKPNLLQMNCNYVITDPSGGVLQQCGETLRRFGYNIRVFDITNMGNCSTYNPMKYCYEEADVKVLVDAFIKNTAAPGEESSSKDPFWDSAMNAFLCAIVSLLVNYGQDPEIMGGKTYIPCFANLCELTRMANKKAEKKPGMSDQLLTQRRPQARQDGPTSADSELNIFFENVRKKYCPTGTEDEPYCLREWGNFKIAPEKTSTTILMTAAVRLDPFNIDKVKDLTSGNIDENGQPTDTLCLDTFGDQKDALFILIPTSGVTTYNFLASFIYTQLFNILFKKAENSRGTAAIKLTNGDLVRWFNQDAVSQNMHTDFLEKIKHTTIEREEINGVLESPKKKGITVDDSIYHIIDANGEIIGSRPTENLAKQYQKQLLSAKIEYGDGVKLPLHTRMLLDEFANSVTRSTPKTVGITDKSVA